jgi:hypothetical protein
MGLSTVAGTTVGISASTPATFDEAGYEALVFTNIGNIEDGGEHGRVYAEVTSNPIDTRGTKKYKAHLMKALNRFQLLMILMTLA